MFLSSKEVAVARGALTLAPKKMAREEMERRVFDPSDELDALSIHKKLGALISGEIVTLEDGKEIDKREFIDGEVELPTSEAKLLARCVKEFRSSIEWIEVKRELHAKLDEFVKSQAKPKE